MRVLIFISIAFLLLNIVVYLLPTDVQTSNARYASGTEVNPAEISFLKDSVPARRRIDVEDIPTLEVSSDDASGSASASANNVTEQICFRIGPFLRESRVEAVEDQLKNMFVGYSIVERQPTNVSANRVYVGPFSDASEAIAARRQLSADGINDHFHRKEEDGNYIVSLGIYSKKQSAEQQQEDFRTKNIAALIREEETELPKNYWLELSRFTTTSKIESVSTIPWGESSASLGKHPCQSSSS